MTGKAAAFAAMLLAGTATTPGRAQDEAPPPPTAEQMIETARETYRPAGTRRACPEGAPGEIVVCAPDPEKYRVESPTEAAIRTGERPRDSIPRAPNTFGIPPCEEMGGCIKMGGTPEPPLIIDLAALPHPLSPEDAAQVREVETVPTEP